jgi:hypothetical protein
MFIWFAITCAVAGSILFAMGLAPRFFSKKTAGGVGAGQRGQLDFRLLIGGGALAIFGIFSLILYGACLAPAGKLHPAVFLDTNASSNGYAAMVEGAANCELETLGIGIAILGAMFLWGVFQTPEGHTNPRHYVSSLPNQRVSRSVFLSNLFLFGIGLVLITGGIWLSLLGASW